MPGLLIGRRHFLGSAAATAAFYPVHDLLSLAVQAGVAAQVQTRPRILSLELLSGAPIGVMNAFYGKTLDLAILEERADRLTIQAGETQDNVRQHPQNGVRVYRTGVTVRGAKNTTYQFADHPYQLGVEEGCSCA